MNRDKINLAVLTGVKEKADEVMNPGLGKNLRFVIFGFTKDRESVIPLVEGTKSNNWEADWTSFKNSLPEVDVAAAVYNFPYWVSDTQFTEESILITWRPDDVDPREIARGGYFLGSIILSTKGVKQKFALSTIDESYNDYCVQVMGIDAGFCGMERDFHNCPFGPTPQSGKGKGSSSDRRVTGGILSPCDASECDGATFEEFKDAAPGSMPDTCCNYITDFCKKNMDFPGCHPVSMTNIELLCEITDPDEIPTVFVDPNYTACDKAVCGEPCTLFDEPSDTFTKCSGCPVNMHKYEEHNNMVMQCHPEALGFQDRRCCGLSAECTDGLSKDECDTLDVFECKHMDHNLCAGFVEEQERLLAEQEQAKKDLLAALEEEEEEEDDEE